MRRLVPCAVLLIAFASVVVAQGRSAVKEAPDERLGTDLRTGRYADARQLIDQMLKTNPRDDLKTVRAMVANGRNMRVQHASARLTCDVRDGVRLPLTVDGARVNWLVDTGANVTTISDAEAARLGLVMSQSGHAVLQDLAGGRTGVRTAIAERIVIGRTELRDVQVLITPANQMPWKELPAGSQGILGLPVLIALDALRWTRAGVCHIGSAATDRASAQEPPNLKFNGLSVIVNVDFDSRALDFVLDTGNQSGTQLWERFGKDFDTLIRERGTKGTVRVTQVGGSNDRDTIVIPDVRLAVGGKATLLRRANVFSRPVGDVASTVSLGWMS